MTMTDSRRGPAMSNSVAASLTIDPVVGRSSRLPPRGPTGKGGAAPRQDGFLPPDTAAFVRRRGTETLGLAISGLGLCLVAMVASYSPSDPSWNTAAAVTGPTINLLGLPGAYLADVLVQTLGLASVLLAGLIVGWGVTVLRHLQPKSWPARILLGLTSVLLTAMVLSALSNAGSGLIPAGGSVGLLLASQVAFLAQTAGLSVSGGGIATLFVLPALCVGLASLGVTPAEAVHTIHSGLRAWQRRRLADAERRSARESQAAHAASFAPVQTPAAARANHQTEEAAPSAASKEATDLSTRLRAVTARLTGRAAGDGETPSAVQQVMRQAPAFFSRGDSPAAAEIPVAAARTALAESEDAARHRPPPVVAPRAKPPEPNRKAERSRQSTLELEQREPGIYELPPLDILQAVDPTRSVRFDEQGLQRNASLLEGVLEDFGVKGEIVKVSPGPVVTLYELEPAPGTKSSRVIGLADDIARSMSAIAVRVAVVPGRNVIGVELPNQKRETVLLRELLESEAYAKTQAKLALVLGKDIGGAPVIADLARMPHLLVAGTTGSGKSVAINTMILSLLYRMPPDRCRFIMVDPKMLELSIYEGIPHLLAPVVTDPKKAVVALKWAVREMEDRYRCMSKLGVRNIDGYNMRLKEAREHGETLTRRVQTGFDSDTGKPVFEDQPIDLTELPYIVVIVDEMADLMLVAGKDIEAAIQRLAQMARAAGIHLIMATQRPSVDVITGTIKANFPTRISFQVTSKIDSRTILGEQGAEQLLGQGDMLYMAGGGRITRVHGPFVRDEEVEEAVKFLKAQGEPQYVDAVTEEEELEAESEGGGGGSGGAAGPAADAAEDIYDQAVALVTRERKASTSFIQRHLRIGYNSAARLIERMEKEGVVGRANHVGKREVLARDVDDRERVN
jgi:DNA segregation ATPase FtsK/SpoIIIE, S-DNA-T family